MSKEFRREVRISINMTPELAARVREAAKKDHRSVSTYLEKIIQDSIGATDARMSLLESLSTKH